MCCKVIRNTSYRSNFEIFQFSFVLDDSSMLLLSFHVKNMYVYN